jgi:signal transduction histidine kinase
VATDQGGIDAYAAHRAYLLTQTFSLTVVVAGATVLLYGIADYLKNPAFFDDAERVVIEMAVPLVALALVRGPLRHRVPFVAFGFDVVYTAFMATGMLAPANTVSGTALFLTLKMVGTALLLRWNPLIQCASTAYTTVLYFGILAVSNRIPPGGPPVHQIVGPIIGAFFSVLGAFAIDRTHRELFLRGQRLAESERQLRTRLDAERTLLRQQREADRLQSEFVNNMSHELRTPLNVIMGYVDLLLESGRLPPHSDEREFGERIRQGARGLHRLVESVLEYAKLDRRSALVMRQTFAADQVLDALRSLCAEVHHRSDVEICIPRAPDLRLHTDQDRLYSVLSNLLLNALKFTAAGRVELCIETTGDRVDFFVADTGIGIPAEQLPYVFEPFRQGDGSITRSHGGMGLGLAIVRRNMELLGGSVGVESTVDVGSTFRVLLPGARAAAEELGVEDRDQPVAAAAD